MPILAPLTRALDQILAGEYGSHSILDRIGECHAEVRY